MWRREIHRVLYLKQFYLNSVEQQRLLCTGSTCLAPRGIRREVVGSIEGTESIYSYEATPVTPENAVDQKIAVKNERKYKNKEYQTHTIDDMDPVVLKYTNMLNQIKVESTEKVHITHFGSIRFDQDNIPQVHGQYGEVVSEPSLKEKFDMLKAEREREGQVSFESENKIDSESNKSDLNYIDDVFFSSSVREENASGQNLISDKGLKDTRENENVTETSYEAPASRSESVKRQKLDQELHFIDETFFGEAYESVQKRTSEETTGKIAQGEGKFTHVAEKLNHADENNSGIDGMMSRNNIGTKPGDLNNAKMNYVDDIFFGDSIERIAENERGPVPFADVRKDVMSSIGSSENNDKSKKIEELSHNYEHNNTKTEQKDQEIKKIDKKTEPKNKTDKKKPKDKPLEPESALEYVKQLRREERRGGEGPRNTYKAVLGLVTDRNKSSFTQHEVLSLLKKSILYNKGGVVGLYKPFGVAMHGGGDGGHHVLTDYLPQLAAHLKADALHVIHRLDADTTGVLLLATTDAMAATLKDMFKARQLKKTYWAITRGVPSPLQGTIDIPIAEGSVEGRRRMVLTPDLEGFKVPQRAKRAITDFRVVSHAYSSALVELSPVTGVRHQLRVHMGFGLGCPVLGDHKYSNIKKIAPQRLAGDTLERLRLKQSRVRDLPMFLHSKRIVLPEFDKGENVIIAARLPAFFNKTISLLKLNRHKNIIKPTQFEEAKTNV